MENKQITLGEDPLESKDENSTNDYDSIPEEAWTKKKEHQITLKRHSPQGSLKQKKIHSMWIYQGESSKRLFIIKFHNLKL